MQRAVVYQTAVYLLKSHNLDIYALTCSKCSSVDWNLGSFSLKEPLTCELMVNSAQQCKLTPLSLLVFPVHGFVVMQGCEYNLELFITVAFADDGLQA